jgi:N utilization substance protein A
MNIDMAALRGLEAEKDIALDTVVEAIEIALLTAYHHTDGAYEHARAELDRRTGEVRVWARDVLADGGLGPEFDDTPTGFGRIAATTARQVILQRLRDAEQDITFGEYADAEGRVLGGVIQQHDSPVRPGERRPVYVDLGRVEGVLPAAEQVPGEVYTHGERLRCYVIEVRKGIRGPSITLSRSHPNLVRKLFAMEVPEVENGQVEIVAIAREAGHRTKIAVRSHAPGVRARGACIGPMGQRVRAVVAELHGEKIDIIDWDADPATYVANALSPATVTAVQVVDAEQRAARVVVPDFQLSLAIGREGQNARLAARLTGWRIDIHPDTEAPPEGADPAAGSRSGLDPAADASGGVQELERPVHEVAHPR